MNLRTIQYREDYRSGHDNLVEDFFRPSLRKAQEYWRAAGYFSSSAFEAFGRPLGEFVQKNGRIRLVTSVELSKADLEAIEAGTAKHKICNDRVAQILAEEFVDGIGDGTVCLVRLLEMNLLEIRIAVPKTGTGIYHEKIGIFLDGDDYVAFTGSSNESRNAFENNRECIDVFMSWASGDSAQRAERKKAHFEALWNREDQGVEVYSFPEAAKKQLVRICAEHNVGYQTPISDKWRHQNEAVKVFLAMERGVLNMATGTGKTRTAIEILITLFKRKDINSVIISTHGTDLLNQWFKELQQVITQLPKNTVVFRHYGVNKGLDNFRLKNNNRILLVSREPSARALTRLSSDQASRTLLIHDEVHGLGSKGNRERLTGLSENIRFRLGLSATPERMYDQEGNIFIENHIGPVLLTFELQKAIERGVLAPFNYFPLRYELTGDDRRRLAGIRGERAAREVAGDPMPNEELWTKIAYVYKISPAKLPIFDEFIANHRDLLKRCIVFVGDTNYGNAVMDIIQKYRADIHTYFSGEDSETLKRFAMGDLECLIACHRLSEGIDIHSLKTVVLFSSDRARLETIQRLGRCLRTDPRNPGKTANIIDFIRQGSNNEDPNTDEERCAWLSELAQIRPME